MANDDLTRSLDVSLLSCERIGAVNWLLEVNLMPDYWLFMWGESVKFSDVKGEFRCGDCVEIDRWDWEGWGEFEVRVGNKSKIWQRFGLVEMENKRIWGRTFMEIDLIVFGMLFEGWFIGLGVVEAVEVRVRENAVVQFNLSRSSSLIQM
jgi:hypothetical protein